MNRTIFGREPAAWIGAIATIATVLAAFIPGLTAGWASAVTALLGSLLMAYATRPATPAIYTGIVAALAALLAEYGLHFSDAQVGAVTAAVLAVFTLVTRAQVEPDVKKISD